MSQAGQKQVNTLVRLYYSFILTFWHSLFCTLITRPPSVYWASIDLVARFICCYRQAQGLVSNEPQDFPITAYCMKSLSVKRSRRKSRFNSKYYKLVFTVLYIVLQTSVVDYIHFPRNHVILTYKHFYTRISQNLEMALLRRKHRIAV